MLCDKRLKLPYVLSFVGRRQLFLQSTPIGGADRHDDLSVSPLPLTDATDITSCSKWVFVPNYENKPDIYVCHKTYMYGDISFRFQHWSGHNWNFYSETWRRNCNRGKQDSDRATCQLESMLFNFGGRSTLSSCQRRWVRRVVIQYLFIHCTGLLLEAIQMA